MLWPFSHTVSHKWTLNILSTCSVKNWLGMGDLICQVLLKCLPHLFSIMNHSIWFKPENPTSMSYMSLAVAYTFLSPTFIDLTLDMTFVLFRQLSIRHSSQFSVSMNVAGGKWNPRLLCRVGMFICLLIQILIL